MYVDLLQDANTAKLHVITVVVQLNVDRYNKLQ